MTDLVLVQASTVIPDAEIIAAIPAFQKWTKLLTDSWALPPCTLSFMRLDQYLAGAAGATPGLLFNKHSPDPTALGYHDVTAAGVPFGRTFSGDDILDGISVWVTAAHEAGEMLLNPYVKNFVTLPDGSITPEEACDAVEDDAQAIVIDNIPFSNFVLPPFYEPLVRQPLGAKYDYKSLMDGNQRLTGPIPNLTPGGYASILRPGAGQQWGQITEMHLGSRPRPSVRQQRYHGSPRHQQLIAAWAAHLKVAEASGAVP